MHVVKIKNINKNSILSIKIKVDQINKRFMHHAHKVVQATHKTPISSNSKPTEIGQVPKSNSPEKYAQKALEISSKLPENIPEFTQVQAKTTSSRIIPDGVYKKGNTYYRVTNQETNNIKTESNPEDEFNFENQIIGVKLNNNNKQEDKTPEQKHVNMATINIENQAELFGYNTSSAGNSTEKINHGIPENLKLNATKADNSFIPLFEVEQNQNTENKADFISTIIISSDTGGQFFRTNKEILIAKQGEYIVSERGTDYVHQNPHVEQKLQKEREKVKNSSKTKKVYNPEEKNSKTNKEDYETPTDK